jgi:hypothetical protein
MQGYSWEDTLPIERDGAAVLDIVFGAEYIVVLANKNHQGQNIDRFLINKKDGRLIHRVDYKIDMKAASTDNFVFEDVSVFKNGQIMADGWMLTSDADLLIIYVRAL